MLKKPFVRLETIVETLIVIFGISIALYGSHLIESNRKNMTTNSTILNCSCKNTYMDEEYGYGKRVFNLSTKNSKENIKGYRCVVCLKEHTVSESNKSVKKRGKNNESL